MCGFIVKTHSFGPQEFTPEISNSENKAVALEQNNTAFEFETMLRRQLSQKSGAQNSMSEICAGFDADSANAYLENGLGTATRARYESHLAGCPSCRHHLVQLSRLIQSPQTEPQFAPLAKPASIWSHWKSVAAEWMELLDASLGKQGWATAGVAAAILMTVASVQVWRQLQASQQPQGSLIAFESQGHAPEQVTSNVSGNVVPMPVESNSDASLGVTRLQIPKPEVSPPIANGFSDNNLRLNAFNSPVSSTPESLGLNVTMPPVPPQARTITTTLVSSASGSATFGSPVQPVILEQAAPAPPPLELQRRENVVAGHINPSPSDNPMAQKAKNSPKPSSRSVFDKALSFMPTSKTESGKKLQETEIEPDAPKVLAVRRRDKVFNYQGGFWVDSAYKPEMAWRVTKLVFDTEDYQQLVAAEPLLKEYFSHGAAIVVWKDKIYKVTSK